MKYPIEGLEAFIEIVDLGSFNRAAQKMNLTQTALTRRIQRLEAQLGLQLLDRTTRSVGLTTLGRDFLPEARQLLEDVHRSFERLRNMSRLSDGDVVIASVPSLMFGRLPRVLHRYALAHPANRVEVLDRNSTRVLEAVRQRHAEFGLHVHLPNQPELHHEAVCRDPFVAYCHEEHPLARRPAVSWAELAQFDLITLGGTSGNRQRMEAQLARAGIDIRTRFVVEYYSTALGLAIEGLGVAILVSFGAQVRPPLVQVPLVDPVIDRPLSLVRRRGETLTPAARSLYRQILAELSPAASAT